MTPLRAPSEPSALTRNFGTTNSEMPLHACRRALDAREHEVDDVLGQVVLAGGDEDLGAGDLVAAVGLRHRLGARAARGRCRNAARSGSSCRSIRRTSSSAGRSPSARASRDAAAPRSRPGSGPGYIANAMLAPTSNSLIDHGQRAGQALAAIFGRHRDAHPAALGILPVGLLEPGRRRHAAVVMARAAFEVADAVERGEHLLGELARPPRGSPRPRRATRRQSPADCRSARCETRRSAGTARPRRAPCRSAC